MPTRETIYFGIDLGTTNSSIAVTDGAPTNVKVFRNAEGWEYTPSAVWLDKNGALRVGRMAKERLESDPDNAHCEFKLEMGESGGKAERVFQRDGRRMAPEQLSSEVLKALRADVERASGETVDAAVITVPAAFELPQCNATRKAAELAGFKQSALLQEPVAAALSYLESFKGDSGYWLVYDFGGGTFDSAVVQLRDGSFECVAHKGDNNLGGKLIDWTIVNELLIPALTSKYRLTEFRRGNPKWRQAIAKLKFAAEEAKIRTTTNEVVEVKNEFVCLDEAGVQVELDFELSRKDVERLTEPYVWRSIEICRQALKEAKLRPEGVNSVLLVGGPTLMPVFRRMLADPKEGLGIPLDFTQDPLTVVARGAAKFARRQLRTVRTAVGEGDKPADVITLDLHYKPVGPESDPVISGNIASSGGISQENLPTVAIIPNAGGSGAEARQDSYAGWTIDFTNITMRPPWSTGRIGLSPDGAFLISLEAEKGVENVFEIKVFDRQGNRRASVPERITYLIAVTVGEQPLINSIGVAEVGNRFKRMLAKGSPLPARSKRQKFMTVVDIKKGEHDTPIVVVSEGDNERADRNQSVLQVSLNAAHLTRDLPAGSEMEVVIEVDESRIVRAKVYIEHLDLEVENTVDWTLYRAATLSPAGLTKEFEVQRKRLEAARQKAKEMTVDKAQKLLLKIDAERIVPEIERELLSAADHQVATGCNGRILDLARQLDAVEDALEWPAQVKQGRTDLDFWKKILEDAYFKATPEEKAEHVRLDREIRAVIQADDGQDIDKLKDLCGALDDVGFAVLRRSPAWWHSRLENLEKRMSDMTDQSQAQAYAAQGHRAMNQNDLDSLKSAVRQLQGLLPRGTAAESKGPIITSR
jgi:molecular chaperone DnaK